MTQPVWSPSAARVAKARLTRFIAGLGEPAVSDYPSLYAWSLQDPEAKRLKAEFALTNHLGGCP